MATAAGPVKQASPSKNDAFVETQLERARRRIRFLDVATALLGLLAGTLAFGLVMALLDSFLELPTAPRGLAFAGYLGAALCYLAVTVVRPLMRRINPYYAARKVEETLPDAKNSVVNWLDLRDDEKLPVPIHHAVSQKAARDLSKADIDQAVSGKRAGWMAVVAGVIFFLFLVLLVCFGAPKFMSHLGRAFLPFSAGGPARRTAITLLDPIDGNLTLSAEQPFTVKVQIDGRIPETVQLMTRPTKEDPETARDLEQENGDQKSWTAYVPGPEVKSPGFFYRVVGGDASTDEYRVTVRSSPIIDMDRFVATFRPRPYVGQTVDRVQRGKRALADLRGTKVSLDVWTNRNIRDGLLTIGSEGKSKRIEAQLDPNNPQRMRFSFVMEQSGTYGIGFNSTDGDRYSDPLPQEISVRPDKPPTVELTKPGIDTAMSINDQLELGGKATDDIGVKELTLHLKADGLPLRSKPYRSDAEIKMADGGYPLKLDYKDSLDLNQVKDTQGRPIELKVGTMLEYWLQAKDACDFPEPNSAESKHFKVTITDVKPDKKKQEEQQKKAEQRRQEHQKQQDRELKKENQDRQEQAKKQKEQQEKEQKEQQEKDKQRNGENQPKNEKPGDKKQDQGNEGGKGKDDPEQKKRDDEAKNIAKKAAEQEQKKQEQQREEKRGNKGKDDKEQRGEGKDDPDKKQDKGNKNDKDKGQNGEAKGNPDKSNDPGKDGGKEAGQQQDKKGEGKKEGQPQQGGQEKAQPKDGQQQGGELKSQGKDGAKPQEQKGQRGECKDCKNGGGDKAGSEKSDGGMQGDKGDAGKSKDAGGQQGAEKGASQGKGEAPQQPRAEGKEGGKEQGQPQASGKSGPKEGDPMAGKTGSEKGGEKNGDEKSASAKGDRIKGDPKQRPEQKPAQEATTSDVNEAAKDLKSDDAGDRESARRRLEQIAKESPDGAAREAAEKELKKESTGEGAAGSKQQPPDGKKGDAAQAKGGGQGDDSKQAAGKESGQGQAQGKGKDDKKDPKKDGSGGFAKGTGETDQRPVKEDLAKLDKAIDQQRKTEGEKRELSRKEIKEMFDQVLEDLKGDDPVKREKARKFLEEVEKQMKEKGIDKDLPQDKVKKAQEEAKKGGIPQGNPGDTTTRLPDRDNPSNSDGTKSDNRHRDRAGDLNISEKTFMELVKNKKYVEDNKLTPEKIENTRRWLKEQESKPQGPVATDKGKPLGTTGIGDRINPSGDKIKNVESSNDGLPPREYRDAYKEFTKKLQEATQGAGANPK